VAGIDLWKCGDSTIAESAAIHKIRKTVISTNPWLSKLFKYYIAD
jgi:hypothetical protein